MHALAGLHEKDGGQADQQRQDRQDVEQPQRLGERLADLLGIGQRGDPGDDRSEHDRRDHHLDDLDEQVPELLEARPEVGEQEPDQDSQGQANQNLYVEELEYFRGLGLHGGVSFDDARREGHDELHTD